LSVNTLSGFQRDTLLWLLGCYQFTERNTREDEEARKQALGHALNAHRRFGISRSQSASESRAIRNLERRGLIVRWNPAGDGHRTTYIAFTEAGRRLAEELDSQR
jgi:hypothetical protein